VDIGKSASLENWHSLKKSERGVGVPHVIFIVTVTIVGAFCALGSGQFAKAPEALEEGLARGASSAIQDANCPDPRHPDSLEKRWKMQCRSLDAKRAKPLSYSRRRLFWSLVGIGIIDNQLAAWRG
jgi:hypothetical protein